MARQQAQVHTLAASLTPTDMAPCSRGMTRVRACTDAGGRGPFSNSKNVVGRGDVSTVLVLPFPRRPFVWWGMGLLWAV